MLIAAASMQCNFKMDNYYILFALNVSKFLVVIGQRSHSPSYFLC